MKKILMITLVCLAVFTGCGLEKYDIQVNKKDSKERRITQDEAIKIVINQISGVSQQNIFIQSEQENGKYIYEGTVIYNCIEYDFEIDGSSGQIIEWNQEKGSTEAADHIEGIINEDEVFKVIKEKLPYVEKNQMFLDFEYDDGNYYFEGKIIYDQKEYEFKINARSRNVEEWQEKNSMYD